MSLEWSQVITWLVVITGWYVVNDKNNDREKRKEVRSLIDSIQNMLDDIEKEAIQYHTNNQSEELSFQIKRNLNNNLSSKVKVLKLKGFEIGKCDKYRKKLRQAITLNNFDTNGFQPQSFTSEIIRDILTSKGNFINEIEKCFSKNYK